MKKAILIVSVLALAGCAHQPLPPEEEMPRQKLMADDKVYAMSRLEVVNAIKDCESARTRAIVVYGKRRVGGMTRDIVVDVTCAPLY